MYPSGFEVFQVPHPHTSRNSCRPSERTVHRVRGLGWRVRDLGLGFFLLGPCARFSVRARALWRHLRGAPQDPIKFDVPIVMAYTCGVVRQTWLISFQCGFYPIWNLHSTSSTLSVNSIFEARAENNVVYWVVHVGSVYFPHHPVLGSV